MQQDPGQTATETIYSTLKELPEDAQIRGIKWISNKLAVQASQIMKSSPKEEREINSFSSMPDFSTYDSFYRYR